MTTQQPNVTGSPRWELAREIVAQLREMPAGVAEANIRGSLFSLLQFLFPDLPQSELTQEKPVEGGSIDVYCRNVVFETKRQGNLDVRVRPDGSTETPEEQAIRYLYALTAQPNMFDDAAAGWRAGVTDGKEWFFYDYDRSADDGAKLTLVHTLRLTEPNDDEELLTRLYDFVNRTVKMAPPTDNVRWAEGLVQPFLDLAARYESRSEYDVKHQLWEGVLRGAFIIPPDDPQSKRELFARHTMLVVVARAIAETLRPAENSIDREQLHRTLTEGFAAWLIDAAEDEGAAAIGALVAEVNSYAWSAANRDLLKDLYHAVISRDIRHDFGEYYTPDWLARAVCEEVLDADWRKEIINMAVAGQLNGPAVLDPSCGSGTFLFHATQLLLEDARQHPELTQSPHAQVEIVNELVVGIDLHPVAVELSKATKMLAFGDLAVHYARFADIDTVYLADSLQWETRRGLVSGELGGMVEIPAVESDDPIRFPSTLFSLDWFPQLLARVFDYAKRPETPHNEAELLAVLNLPSQFDREAVGALYRRFREYISSSRNNVWEWYVANLIQPHRLANMPVSRMVGNPPWVVYNSMADDRQNTFRQHALERNLWAGRHLATQNDLAATFVATCVDFYLQYGGAFGFVLPYAALRARHWASFRTGEWSLQRDSEQGTHVDLSKDAWDFYRVNAPPFPQANSSVVFGTKVRADRQSPNLNPLGSIQEATGSGISTNMAWEDVKPKLTFTQRKEWAIRPSPAYADAFRAGATLFPQSLVVFERPQSRLRGTVYFRTNTAKGAWRGTHREGEVEERFVKPAVFSRLLLPFGTSGHSHIIAPFADDGESVLQDWPQDDNVRRFSFYWSTANADYVRIKSPKSPDTLARRIDLFGNLSAQLKGGDTTKVAYNASGSNLTAVVISNDMVVSHNVYWAGSDDDSGNYYLAAILNAPCLGDFFKEACRASDRDFMSLPVQNLPIPAYDANNEHHANLAAQSQLAHARVAALVAERQAAGRRVNRNDALNDPAMQPILASIDQSVRAVLPDFCS